MTSPTTRLLEIPDADAAEQSRELRPSPGADGRPVDAAPGTVHTGEADEFDAVEQCQVVDQDDEEEYR